MIGSRRLWQTWHWVMAMSGKPAHRELRKPGVIGRMFGLIGRIAAIPLFLMLSIFLGTLIEWGGMMAGLWEKDHAAKVLQAEFAYLGDNFTTTVFGVSAHDGAVAITRFVQEKLVGVPSTGAGNNLWFGRFLQNLGNRTAPYGHAFVFVVMINAIRFFILLLSSALYVLVAIAATVDGLHLRELRKVGGGVEHAAVYHHAKSWISIAMVAPPVIYLTIPVSINPNVILLPGMALFYLAVLTSFATFKKYL